MISETTVRQIRNVSSLFDFLREELSWQLPADATIDDVTFDWTGEDLSLSESTTRRLSGGRVRQLRPFRHDQPWGVFLVEFNDSHVYRTVLRQVVRRLVPNRRQDPSRPAWHHENLLFICTSADQQFTFAHFRGERPQRAKLINFSWSPDDPIRTLCEFNLPALRFPQDGGQDREGWLRQWQRAFDVEAVTAQFFGEYRMVFEKVEGRIRGVPEGEPLRMFAQTLFNRLMFIHFLQKKGWLDHNKRYLRHLFEVARSEASGHGRISDRHNFYDDYLRLLFFWALNTSLDARLPDDAMLALQQKLGEVPFLNGGLFEEQSEYDYSDAVHIPNEAFSAILDLFERYNFTVTESTPLDIEVAIDPEMLGRIFEELVTGRHETGSYYTPKPVVAFMCRESLKRYLATALSTESPNSIGQFVDEQDPAGLKNPEAVLEAVRRVRVCDPACGSGAYLLGMLRELLDLRACLFASHHLDPLTIYERKLEIIQNNLYGVDIDPFAVNIARLRLWLSLIVDFEGDDPPPLPNLDFKIEVGDSLIAPDPSAGIQSGFRDQQIKEYFRLKSEYMHSHSDKKLNLRKQIDILKQEIALWAHQGRPVTGFDWPVEFAEVFADGGFDIVLANPPYVRADAQFKHLMDERERQAAIARWKDYRKGLKKSDIYKTLYEKWDLYIPFLERAYQLLRLGGQMVFIISDAYNAAKYTRKSHDFFLKNAYIERIDFCTDIDIFDAGVNNTIVNFAKATPDARHAPTRIRRWGESRDDFEHNAEILPTGPQSEFGSALFRPDGQKPVQLTQGFVPLEKICYISYGLRANADERYWQGEFATEDCLSKIKNKNHPKSFVQGKDLAKWWVRQVWYLEWNTERAPKKFSRPTFPELHEVREKLVAMRTPGAEPKVIYDQDCLHFDASSVGFVPWHYLEGLTNRSISKTSKYSWQAPDGDREEREKLSQQFHLKYLLAVMNSAFTQKWLSTRRRSKRHIYPDDWKPLPIVPIPMEQQQELVKLVDASLAEFNQHGYPLPSDAAKRVAEWERRIDERVTALYKL